MIMKKTLIIHSAMNLNILGVRCIIISLKAASIHKM